MVHNGIEYGMMAAFAGGLSMLRSARVGKADQAHYPYDMKLENITEGWRRGSVVGSRLIDLTAAALHVEKKS